MTRPSLLRLAILERDKKGISFVNLFRIAAAITHSPIAKLLFIFYTIIIIYVLVMQCIRHNVFELRGFSEVRGTPNPFYHCQRFIVKRANADVKAIARNVD